MAEQKTTKLADDYQPPDTKYIEQVLEVVEREHNVSVGQVDIYVARPGKGPMRSPTGDKLPIFGDLTETVYEALLREVPRLLAELREFKSERRVVAALLREMIAGDFVRSSERVMLGHDAPGELGEQRRQALMMHYSMSRRQNYRDDVRSELRLRGEFSE